MPRLKLQRRARTFTKIGGDIGPAANRARRDLAAVPALTAERLHHNPDAVGEGQFRTCGDQRADVIGGGPAIVHRPTVGINNHGQPVGEPETDAARHGGGLPQAGGPAGIGIKCQGQGRVAEQHIDGAV